MLPYLLPALYAAFAWWFSTGLVMYLDGLPRRTFRWSMAGATALLAASLYGLAAGAADTSVFGAFAAFTWGLLAWAWLEMSFYTGYVTGPRKHACHEGCRGWRHFGHAVMVSLWHELAILACAAAVAWATWGGANRVGLWTFVTLWGMHQSARLNVFLGVRNLNAEFLPGHLAYLRSFLRKRRMNPLFPVSVAVSTAVLAWLVSRAAAADAGSDAGAFEAAGHSLLAALMALAILEHWFLVLPLPTAALWSWGLRSRTPRAEPARVELARVELARRAGETVA